MVFLFVAYLLIQETKLVFTVLLKKYTNNCVSRKKDIRFLCIGLCVNLKLNKIVLSKFIQRARKEIRLFALAAKNELFEPFNILLCKTRVNEYNMNIIFPHFFPIANK